METASNTGQKFDRLVAIMARLRAPGGCPWDREQSFDTIKPYLLEETYEVMDAIDRHDWPGLREELGDLLLQVVFFARLAADEGLFAIDDSIDAICDKLVRRHPHVFGAGVAKTADDVKRRWDEIKAEEKTRDSLLAGVPRNLPALAEAQRLGLKAAGVGFDWETTSQVVDKVREELGELASARAGQQQDRVEEELGDVLFAIANLARFVRVDPEQALRKANAKFRRRFEYVERNAALPGASLDEMEALWQQAKLAL